MQIRTRSRVAGGLLVAAFLLLLPALGGTGWTEEGCGPMVRNKCSSCHFVTHICPKIKQGKGSFYWKRIVDNMVTDGMVATEEEQKRLAQCLASPDGKVKALCPQL